MTLCREEENQRKNKLAGQYGQEEAFGHGGQEMEERGIDNSEESGFKSKHNAKPDIKRKREQPTETLEETLEDLEEQAKNLLAKKLKSRSNPS